MTLELITGFIAAVLLLAIPVALVVAGRLQAGLRQQIAGGDDSVRAQLQRISEETAHMREAANRLPVGK